MLLIWGIIGGIIGALCYYFGYKHGRKTSEGIYQMGAVSLEEADERMARANELLEDCARLNDETAEMVEKQRADNAQFYEEVNAQIELLKSLEAEGTTDA